MAVAKVLIRAPADRERRASQRLTGRYLVTVQKGAHGDLASKLSAAGFASPNPLKAGAMSAHALPQGGHISFPNLGIALVDPLPGQEDALHTMAATEDTILSLEPERIVRAVGQVDADEYIRGWRDAIEALTGKLLEEGRSTPIAPTATTTEAFVTWGLASTKVATSRYTGAKVKVAILDTGLDLTHPDFKGRDISVMNFVGDGKQFHDGVGHGTHCAGTAAGPLHPLLRPRYGISYDAQLFAGRVLDDTGQGGDGNILQGIDWAIGQGCDIVSLSLGSHWFPGDPPFSQAYETAAKRALAANCLLIVAAGNDMNDPRYVGAVAPPGNSPSALTVAAIDHTLATASFSNRARPEAPGVKGPDLAGPGVDVRSSWPVSDGEYNTISGTSMATPHVAGIAALYAEANPNVRGQALKDMILAHCEALPDAAARQGEVGKGLVQAPANDGRAPASARQSAKRHRPAG
jgi:subtilisin